MDEYIKREDALNALLYEMVGTGYQSTAMMAIQFIPAANVAPRAEVAMEIFGEIEEAFDPTVTALFCIGEILVDVSKSHISEEDAIEKIREYLSGTICSKYRLRKMLAELRKKYESEGADDE